MNDLADETALTLLGYPAEDREAYFFRALDTYVRAIRRQWPEASDDTIEESAISFGRDVLAKLAAMSRRSAPGEAGRA